MHRKHQSVSMVPISKLFGQISVDKKVVNNINEAFGGNSLTHTALKESIDSYVTQVNLQKKRKVEVA